MRPNAIVTVLVVAGSLALGAPGALTGWGQQAGEERGSDRERAIAERFAVVTLPDAATDFAFDPQLGRLAIAGSFGASLGVYASSDLAPGKSARPRLVDLGGPVVSVLAKPWQDKRLFVAGVDQPPRLVVVDAQALKVMQSFLLETGVPRQLAASLAADDPFVVFLSQPDLAGPRRFDLAQGKEERRLGADFVDFAISPDGKSIYFRSSSQRLGRGLHLADFGEPSAQNPSGLQKRAFKFGETPPAFPDPRGWLVALGRQALSPDLATVVNSAALEPQAFFLDSPWMAGLNREQFAIGSINDFRTVAEVPLPAQWLAVEAERKAIGFRPRGLRWDQPLPLAKVFADPIGKGFLLGTRRHVAAFPLAAFDLPDEPILRPVSEMPQAAVAGQPLRVELKFPGAAPAVSLGKHPEGMSLNGRVLAWTPEARQLGEHEVEIVAQAGDVRRKEAWTIHVERLSLEIPFEANGGICLTADGRRAVVWGERVAVSDRLLAFQRLASFDLQGRKLLATRRAAAPFVGAVIVGDDVYLPSEDRMARLSIDSLEPSQAPGEVELPRDSTLILAIPDRRPVRFNMRDLAQSKEYDHDVNSGEGWLAGRTGFGWLSQGILWDEATQKPLLLLWPYEFRRVPWQNSLGSSLRRPGASLSAGRWHPCGDAAQPKPRTDPDESLLAVGPTPDLPATLALARTSSGFQLAVYSLVHGRKAASSPLVFEKPPPTSGRSPARAPDAAVIGTSPQAYAVALRRRLYHGALDELDGSLETPLHIQPRQSTFVLPLAGPTTVRYQAVGATKLRLHSELRVDDTPLWLAESSSGEFEVDTSRLLDAALDAHAGLVANLDQARGADNNARLENYLQAAQNAFWRLTGRAPQGVPVPIGAVVSAEDGNARTAWLRHDYLIDVPRERLLAALDKKYPHGRDPWRRPEPSETVGPPPTDPLHAYMRKVAAQPRPTESGDALRDQARQAKQVGDERLRQRFVEWTARFGWRTWIDKKGAKIEALVVERFGGQVVLRTRRGAELVMDERQLSDADQDYLAKRDAPATPSDLPQWREFTFFWAHSALKGFLGAHSFLPPRALVDDAGAAALSWRVLLLPQLGFQELYSLFRFDEPWDSPHNRALLEFMPDCFAVDLAAAGEHKTPLVVISSQLSAMRTDRGVTTQALGAEASSTVVFVEAAAAGAVEWTRPVDLRLSDLAAPTEALRVRDGKIMTSLLHRPVQLVPADTPRDAWRWGVETGDHRPFPGPPMP